jgi:hypothetical protein
MASHLRKVATGISPDRAGRGKRTRMRWLLSWRQFRWVSSYDSCIS